MFSVRRITRYKSIYDPRSLVACIDVCPTCNDAIFEEGHIPKIDFTRVLYYK